MPNEWRRRIHAKQEQITLQVAEEDKDFVQATFRAASPRKALRIALSGDGRVKSLECDENSCSDLSDMDIADEIMEAHRTARLTAIQHRQSATEKSFTKHASLSNACIPSGSYK